MSLMCPQPSTESASLPGMACISSPVAYTYYSDVTSVFKGVALVSSVAVSLMLNVSLKMFKMNTKTTTKTTILIQYSGEAVVVIS